MTLPVLLGLTLCVALGTYVQLHVGFGMNLLLAPFSLLFFPEMLPLGALIVNGALSLVVVLRDRQALTRALLVPLLIATIPGTVIGLVALEVLPTRTLALLAAAVVLLATISTAVKWVLPDTRFSRIGAGAFSGFLSAVTSITGPPIALILGRRDAPTRRATVAAVGVFVTITSLVGAIVLSPSTAAEGVSSVLWVIPGVAIGALASHLVTLPEELQRRVTLGAAGLGAASVIVRNIL